MTSDKVRIGIAGCGKIAQVGHVPGIQASDVGCVTALCDKDIERAEALRDEQAPDADVFDSLEEMLNSGIDAICVCTPNNLHYPMTMKALEAGVHVLCDKPIAAKLSEASEMVEASKKTGKVLHINQSLRYHPMFRTIAELIKEGAIGDLIHLRCIRGGSQTPDRGWSKGASWFVSKEAQGGLTLDIGVHMADLLTWYAGEAEQVSAYSHTRLPDIDVEDNVNAMIQFKNKTVGMLELSWTLPTGAGFLEIYGTEGCIRNGFSEEPIELITVSDGEKTTSYPELNEEGKDSYQAFIDAVLKRAPSPTPGELGRDALALCVAIKESSGLRKSINVTHF